MRVWGYPQKRLSSWDDTSGSLRYVSGELVVVLTPGAEYEELNRIIQLNKGISRSKHTYADDEVFMVIWFPYNAAGSPGYLDVIAGDIKSRVQGVKRVSRHQVPL